jgi:hypothetical protein
MVPDVSPDDGMQPEPQFVPPHVRLGDGGVVAGTGVVVDTCVVEVVGTGVVEVVACSMLHVPVKPLFVTP